MKRWLIALAAGFLGLGLAPFSIEMGFGGKGVLNVVFSPLFPLLVAMAWGPRWALVAAIPGLGALFPFLIWPQNGWANIASSILFLGWFLWMGRWGGLRPGKLSGQLRPILATLAFIPLIWAVYVYPFLHLVQLNPPPWAPSARSYISTAFLYSILVKSSLNLILLASFAGALWQLPGIRRFFGIAGGGESARFNNAIITGFIVLALGFWASINLVRSPWIGNEVRWIFALILICAILVGGTIAAAFAEHKVLQKMQMISAQLHYRQLVGQLARGVVFLDENGIVVDANSAALELLGTSREEIIGRFSRDPRWGLVREDGTRMPEEEQPAYLARTQQTNFPPVVVGVLLQNSGERRWLSVSGIALTQDTGTPVRSAAVFHDITNAKELQGRLQHAEADLQGLYLHLRSGFLLCSHDGDDDFLVQKINPSFEALSGLREGDVVGKQLSQLLGGRESPLFQCALGVRGIEMVQEREGEVPGERVFQVRGYAPSPGRVALLVGDVTECRRCDRAQLLANQKLVERIEELESLLYVVSHDLRSPLVNLRGFAAELDHLVSPAFVDAADPKGADEIRESLHFIRAGADRMESLLSGVMRLSRLGRIVVQQQRIGMDELVASLVQSLAYELQACGGRIEVNPLPSCMGDRSLLQGVIGNLLDNAIKYRRPDVSLVVTITGYRRSNESWYEIADNGLGIPEYLHGKAFEPFWRQSGVSAEIRGEGLGLALVRRSLAQMGASIALASGNPGLIARIRVAT